MHRKCVQNNTFWLWTTQCVKPCSLNLFLLPLWAPDVFTLHGSAAHNNSGPWKMVARQSIKRKKHTSQITPSHLLTKRCQFEKWWLLQEGRSSPLFLFQSRLSVERSQQSRVKLIGSLRRCFSYSKFNFSCRLLHLPANGRGWDLCPSLCFNLPGKVELKGTKGPRIEKDIPPARQLGINTLSISWTRTVAPSWEEPGFDCLFLELAEGMDFTLDYPGDFFYIKKLFMLDGVGVSSHLAVASLL